jgi:hypothetical protein
MEYVIYKHKGCTSFWYDFEDLPVDTYFQIMNMKCRTDRKAISQAKKIVLDKKATFVIKEVSE